MTQQSGRCLRLAQDPMSLACIILYRNSFTKTNRKFIENKNIVVTKYLNHYLESEILGYI